MENPAKKIKLSDEYSSTLDPFKIIHENLHELIYQHFRGKEVSNLFTVSQIWNQRTGDSPAAMRKIQLKFRETSSRNPSPQEVTALLNSGRKYQNVEASFRFMTNAVRKLLLLQRFSPSIVNLKIEINLTLFLPTQLSFPKLKSLNADGYIAQQQYLIMIQNANGLEKLEISVKNAELFNCIMTKKNLKELKLKGNIKSFFGIQSTAVPQFKLTSLSVEETRYNINANPLAQSNFNKFVLHMAESLTTLSFEHCSSDDLDLVLNKLPALTSVKIHNIRREINENRLKPNNKIKAFKCNVVNNFPRDVLACFTGLEVLMASQVDEEDFEWIVQNMRELKQLHLKYWGNDDWMDDSDVEADIDVIEDFYDELIENDGTINTNINIVIIE
jgi:hypothetical protein